VKSEGHSLRWLSGKAAKVPCRGSGGNHTTERDCSQPNIRAAITAPWIDRPQK
jgi:hypothetical protein